MSRRVVALVDDLMDRSRLGILGEVAWATSAVAAATLDPEVVVVDIARYGTQIGALRDLAPTALIVGFGPHVDGPILDEARRAGADRVLPRSRFFADPTAAVAPDAGSARA